MDKMTSQKRELLLEMLGNVRKWNRDVEVAKEILNKNETIIKEMVLIDVKLPEEELKQFNQEFAADWQEIIEKQLEMQLSIREEKNKIEQQLIQMGKKKQVSSHYIALQNKSIFIEKNY